LRRVQILLAPKPNKRITTLAITTQPRARNMEKGYAMVVACMGMRVLYVHTRVGLISVKWPNKRNSTK
jgi:hypothetical protein